MWYTEKLSVNLSKPILAISDSSEVELLLPQISSDPRGSYDIIGYNWFDLEKGEYNSKAFFPTVQSAIQARGYGFTVRNMIESDIKYFI